MSQGHQLPRQEVNGSGRFMPSGSSTRAFSPQSLDSCGAAFEEEAVEVTRLLTSGSSLPLKQTATLRASSGKLHSPRGASELLPWTP